MRKRLKLKAGDKLIPLPDAVFIYNLTEDTVLEVEYQLISPELDGFNFDGKNSSLTGYKNLIKDTYVHFFRSRDYTQRFKFGKKSFAIDSRFFRLITKEDEAGFMLDEL